MKVILPQIALHTNDAGKNVRVLSLDINPNCNIIITGGADCSAKLWKFQLEEPFLKYVCTVASHGKSVNIVRFSPDMKYLCTASDDGLIYLFEPVEGNWTKVSNKKDLVLRTIRGHASDIYALAWSPDSRHFISGSIDSTTILWRVTPGKDPILVESFRNHCHFVQGAVFHPSGTQFVTQSSDRTCKAYNVKNFKLRDIFRRDVSETGKEEPLLNSFRTEPVKPKYTFINDISRRVIAPQQIIDGKTINPKKTRLFMDDSLPSFFRRLAYSPDGSLLIVPAGKFKNKITQSKEVECCYIFSALSLTKPICALSGFSNPPVCVSFCPLKFKCQNKEKSSTILKAPYKYIFCILTLKDIVLYDTENTKPIAIVADAHYAQLTDASWLLREDKLYLFVSSSDGYISIVDFNISEIGEIIPEKQQDTIDIFDYGSKIKSSFKPDDLLPVLSKVTRKRRLKLNSVSNALKEEVGAQVEVSKRPPDSKPTVVKAVGPLRRVLLTQVPDTT